MAQAMRGSASAKRNTFSAGCWTDAMNTKWDYAPGVLGERSGPVDFLSRGLGVRFAWQMFHGGGMFLFP